MRHDLKQTRKGATAVEFAMVAPTLFLLALGVFEFGRGFMVQHLLSSTARQACRYGVVPGRSTNAIQSLAASTLTAQGISGTTTAVQVDGTSTDAGSAQSNAEITVIVSVPVSSITVIPAGGYLRGTLTGQCTMRRE